MQHTQSLHATMLHAPAPRNKYEGNRPGQSVVSRYVVCRDRLGLTGLHTCMVSCKIKSQGACHWSWHWTYSEHTVNATLNTHWTQSKKLQIAANLCSWWWFSEKSTNIEFSFDFHGFALSLSFLSVLCLVHCMFNVRSMYVHCQFIASAWYLS